MYAGSVLAVIGGQYGSEGKGVIVQNIARNYDVHVRVGGPNAGHSIFHRGQVYKMQCIPCGWINSRAVLVIGAGAYVDVEQLRKELNMIEAVDPTIRKRVYIDGSANIICPDHKFYESELKESVASTGEGVGGARVARIARGKMLVVQARDIYRELTTGDEFHEGLGVNVAETVELLHGRRRHGCNILLEGTQGAGLSLIHGEWPYTTSHDVSAAQMLADIGLPIKGVNIVMVLRTYPIRVGGNSGPLKKEVSWEYLSMVTGIPNLVEHTTVTKKVRRVASFDEEMVRKSIIRNEPDFLAITFMDYINPEDTGKTRFHTLSNKAKNFIRGVEGAFSVPVKYIGTGWRDNDGWQVITK